MRLLLIFALLFASIEDSHARRRRKSSSSSSRSSGKSGGWETAAGIGYSTQNIKVNKTTVLGIDGSQISTINKEIELVFDGSISFSIDSRSIENYSWGTIFGLEYFKNKLEETIEDGKATKCTVCSEIQTTNIFISTFYQWEKVYIPFGIFYSLRKYSSQNGSFEIENQLGFNIGLGVKVYEKYIFEINSRALPFKMTRTYSDNSKLVFEGDSTITSLSLKVLF
jgi:hypothetical protein